MVYAFEAAPLIAPYVESCTVELTAGRPIPPAPVPPTGSTADFLAYVRSNEELRVCDKGGASRIKACVFALPAMVRNMSRLSVDPVLGSRETVEARLAAAGHACPERHSYTAIHAAASDANGTATMGGGIEQLMVGGSKPLFAGQSGLYMHNESIGGQAHRSQWDVRSVDTVRWIQHNVRPEDFFVLKMDIEGFEHKLIPSMLEANLTDLIDVFVWECHYGVIGSKCHSLFARAASVPGFLPKAVYTESSSRGHYQKMELPRREGAISNRMTGRHEGVSRKRIGRARRALK